MKHETVPATAFAIPLTYPALPSGSYRFVNREYFIIRYRTDPEAFRRVVPAPFELTERVVNYEFIRIPDSTGFGDYTGQAIILRGPDRQLRPSDVSQRSYADRRRARAVEIFRKLAHPKLAVETDTLVGTRQMECHPRHQPVGSVSRHCDGRAADEDAGLGADRQHCLCPLPCRVDPQGCLRCGQARTGRPDQGFRPRNCRQRRYLQCSLLRVGANSARGKADQRHRCMKRYQPERGDRGASRREPTVAGVCHPCAAWQHCRFPLSGGGRPDHRYRHLNRWRMDRPIT